MRWQFLCAFVVFGCGKVHDNRPPDAADTTGDAGVDAPAFGPVDLTFYYGEPIADASVFVFDKAGALVFETTTGPGGTKHLDNVPRGGSITVGKVVGGAPRVRSVYGVEPGDDLKLGYGSAFGATVNLTATTTLSGYTYVIGAGCDAVSYNTLTAIQAYTNCRTGGAWTLVALASANNAVQQFTVVPGVTTNASLSTWHPASEMSDFLVGFSSPLPGTSNVQIAFRNWPTAGPGSQQFTTSSGNAAFRYAAIPGEKLTYSVIDNVGAQAATSLTRSITPIRMENVNLAALLLPAMTSVATDFASPLRPVMTWAADPAISSAADMVSIQANWDGTGYYEWGILLPSGSDRTFQFPAIPISHVELLPPSGATWSFGATVSYVDATELTYAQIRQLPDRSFDGRSTYYSYSKAQLFTGAR
jgi:hypothetical protein